MQDRSVFLQNNLRASIMIRVTNDNGDTSIGSLGAAIIEANESHEKFVTITFAPGIHAINLSVVLTIEVNLKIIGDKIKITALSGSSIFVVNPDIALYIDGLELTGANSAIFVENSSLFLDNVNIHDNTGGGIQTAGNLTIKNSNVSNNTDALDDGCGIHVGGNLVMFDTRVCNNIRAGGSNTRGGGVFVGGTAKIKNSYICDNQCNTVSALSATTSFGGGIYVTGCATIECSQIYNNVCNSESLTLADTASSSGGGIYCADKLTIIESRIYNNTCTTNAGVNAHATSSGGGIYSAMDMFIKNSQISTNTCTNTSTPENLNIFGGGIYAQMNLSIENSQIYDNNCNGSTNGVSDSHCVGGGMYVVLILTIDNSQIYNNMCNSNNGSGDVQSTGGGIHVIINSTIKKSRIYGNLCTTNTTGKFTCNGGGISNVATATIEDSQIYDNSCVSNNPFESVHASLNVAGGVAAINLIITNVQIYNNTAQTGAGILCNLLITKKSHIHHNNASQFAGGAVVLLSATLIDSTIDNNTVASGMVGGIYVDDGNLTMRNSSICNNVAFAQTGSLLFPMCGGLMISNGSLLAVDSHIDGNRSKWIGAILVGIGTVNLINTTVNDNISKCSTDYGCSAITNISGGVNVFNSTIKRNKTDGWFGSIVAFSNVTITNSELAENIASGPAGIVEILDSSVIIRDSKLSDNIGTAFGATVASFSEVNPIVISGSQVYKNKLNSKRTIADIIDAYPSVLDQSNGFLVQLSNNLQIIPFAHSDALITLLPSIETAVSTKVFPTLSGILANASGGIIGTLLTCQISIIDSKIYDNEACDIDNNTTYGGAIFALGGSIVTEKSIVQNNKSVDGGSALYTQGSATLCDTTVDKNKTDRGTIYIDGGQLIAIDAIMRYNKVTNDGGAIYNTGTLEIIDSKITNNDAQSGGGIYSTVNPITLIDSHVDCNHPDNIKFQ